MRKRIKPVITILLSAAVLSLLLWRLWPRPLSAVLSTQEDAVTSLSCTVSVGGIRNSAPYIDSSQLSLTRGGEDFAAIMALFNDYTYLPSFWNLLPWAAASPFPEEGSRKTAHISLVCSTTGEEQISLFLTGDGRIAVSTGAGTRFRVYYAAEAGLLDRLADYVQSRGT